MNTRSKWNPKAVCVAPYIPTTMSPVEGTLYNYKRILKQYRRLIVPDVIYAIEGTRSNKVVYTTCSICGGSGSYQGSGALPQDRECTNCNGLGALWLPRPKLVVKHLRELLLQATQSAVKDYLSDRDSNSLSHFLTEVKMFQEEMSKYWNGIPAEKHSIWHHVLRSGIQSAVRESVEILAIALRNHSVITGGS